MDCASCGAEGQEGARYCDRCGADLALTPKPGAVPMTPSAVAAPAPPHFLYAPLRPPAWWYPLALWAVLAAVFLALDALGSGRITWSVWPVGLLGIFLVGFPLLHRLEAWSATRLERRTLK